MANDPDFKPDLTPEQMHMMGVLGPQYYGEDAKEHNFFGIDASQNDWPSEWKDGKAPRGWFQWYAGYANGKRTPDDERQIRRWKSFKARHMGPLKKADPSLKDLGVHTRRRQALLHWGLAPGINPSDHVSTSGVKVTDDTLKNPPVPDTPMKRKKRKEREKTASMRTNPYLEKIASYKSNVVRARYDHDRPYTGEVTLSDEEKSYFETDRQVRKSDLDRKAKKVIPAVMGVTGTLGGLGGLASRRPKAGGVIGAGVGLGLSGAASYLGYKGSEYANQNAVEQDAVRRNPVLNKLMQNQEFSHAISEPERLAWEDVDLDEMSPTQEETINTLYGNWAKERDFRPPSVVTEYDREGNPNRLSVTIDERNRYRPALKSN